MNDRQNSRFSYSRLRNMIPMRSALLSRIRLNYDASYKAFCCMHVRTATLLLGFFQAFLSIATIGFLLFLFFRPDVLHMMHSREFGMEHHNEHDEHHHGHHVGHMLQSDVSRNPFQNLIDLANRHSMLKSPRDHENEKSSSSWIFNKIFISFGKDGKMHAKQEISKIDGSGHKETIARSGEAQLKDGRLVLKELPPKHKFMLAHHHKFGHCTRQHLFVLAVVTVGLILCFMLLAGVLLKQPILMLPYMCAMVFCILANTLCLVGFVAYMPNAKLWIVKSHIPNELKMDLLRIDNKVLTATLFLTMLSMYMFKLYLTVVVFRCYSFLANERRMALRMREVVRQTYDVLPNIVIADDKGEVKLPNYDDSVAKPATAYAPPPYVDAKKPPTDAEEKE